jgi:hypothetical protein
VTGCSAIERSATTRRKLKLNLTNWLLFHLGAQLNGESRHQDCLPMPAFDKEIIAGKRFKVYLD